MKLTTSEPGPQAASGPPSAEGALAVHVEHVRKVYGPTIALADASLTVRAGEIHALLGENGAGKSTLVRILAGLEPADGGQVSLLGQPAGGDSAARASQCGFIHQDLGLFDDLTVAENIALAGGFEQTFGVIRNRRSIQRARSLLAELDMDDIDPTARAGDLLLADQTKVAIARALGGGVRLVVLDEPTAYLEVAEARRLFALLHRLRDRAVTCLLITHRAEDVLVHCDRFTVFRDGMDVASLDTAGATESDLVRLITGHDEAVRKPDGTGRRPAAAALSLRGFSGPGFQPLDLEVGAGEIVALCGLADAGHFAVGEAIFGLLEHTGTTTLAGDEVRIASPARALGAGIGYVPRDRRSMGVIPGLTITENILSHAAVPWYRLVHARKERPRTAALMTEFHVSPADPGRDIATFSGGNQQKVLLAKWFSVATRLIILNEPTAGVDLGARAEIYSSIRQMCQLRGIGALIISSDFVEIAEFCDRAVVLRRGAIAGELPPGRMNVTDLTEIAYGGTA